MPNGIAIEQALATLADRILFDDSSGFYEMMWTIILPDKKNGYCI